MQFQIRRIKVFIYSIPLVLGFTLHAAGDAFERTTISSEGNSYTTRLKDGSKAVSLWFKAEEPGDLNLYIKADAPANGLNVSINGSQWTHVQLAAGNEANIGKIRITKPQYVRMDFKNLESRYEIIAEGKNETVKALKFVQGFSTYWGRRGPSVYINYYLPETDVEYFYNEVVVPKGNDVLGTYFMANGFNEGYCGIQANSITERCILFSVWSPFATEDPAKVPEDFKVRLLVKGEGVLTDDFRDEGTGGKSWLMYNWKAGIAYKFITRVHPDGKGNTIYTTWFYDYDRKSWRLIAGFLRPKTDTWYKKPHSFLENLNPDHGWITRKVFFQNQHVRTTDGKWVELTAGAFSYDGTAHAGVRKDYAGGVEGTRFFLRNCGFFNENTAEGAIFNRKSRNVSFNLDPAVLPEK